MKFRYTYNTPLGVSFEDIVAPSRVIAERKFWQRHMVDTCDVMNVVSTGNLNDNEFPGDDALTNEQRAKAWFVQQINSALLICGEGRYSSLEDEPLTYVVEGSEEYVACGQRRACVTGDSLIAIMRDIVEQLNWW